MKKYLLLLLSLVFVFSLAACQEDTTLQDSITDLEAIVSENADDNAALMGSLAMLEDQLDDLALALENESNLALFFHDNAITKINAVKETILEIQASDRITAAVIADLQAQITALDGAIALINAEAPILEPNMGTEIVIAHTNDVHGRVNEDSYNGTMGMSTVKNILDALHKQYENVFLVSAGDIVHGTTFATLEEGASVINVMNQVGYDLMVPGNHDFDYGQDRLLELEEMANFPMITANIQYAEDDTDFMTPYYIQDFDGVKVGFFGLTSPETTYKTHPDNVIGLNFLDPIAQAEAMVTLLDPMVDVIICLAHIGMDESTLVTTVDIAEAVTGIDVIVDGHSHTELPEGMMVGDTLIVSTGEYLNNLGVFTITVKNGEVINIDAMLISPADAETLDYGVDKDLQTYIDDIITAQDVILGEVVGQTAVILDGERANVRTGETNLGDIITDSMLLVTGADVALTNGGGIRASIAIGDVTLGDIITVLPFGNIITTKDLTGAELLAALEWGTHSYPESLGAFSHVAGVTFDINLNNAEGARVENVMVAGVALDLEAIYSVATNDFIAAGGDGYTMFSNGPATGEFMGLHEALALMFTVGEDITIPTAGRITVIELTE